MPLRLPSIALLLMLALAPDGARAAAATGETRPIRTHVTLQRTAPPPDIAAVAAAMEADRDPLPGMAKVEGFITRYPSDGQAGSERTVVYLGYDDQNLSAVQNRRGMQGSLFVHRRGQMK